MKYSCDHCPYETDKKANYLRHLSRKFRCSKKVVVGYEKVHAGYEKIHAGYEKVHADYEKVHAGYEKIHAGYEKIHAGYETSNDLKSVSENGEIYECSKCQKKLACKQNLLYHEERCKGCPKSICEICFKSFSTPKGKYQHQRTVLCYPPPQPDSEASENNILNNKESEETTTPVQPIASLINATNNSNNINQNTTTNSNNNNNTVNNNIITFNSFGDEGIEQLGEYLSGRKDDSKIIERMRQLGKKKIYGIREIQNDIFFNPDNPEGFSIIKPEKYGSSVRVRNSEGEFEYMEFADVRDPLLDYIEKYIDIYNKTRNKYNVKFRDPKERRILQNFFKIMNDDLDIYLNEDLKEDLSIRESKDSESQQSEDVKYKRFDRVSLDNIHVQTKKFFICKKGEFVLKEKKLCID
jgi:hypothetical protein